MFDSESGQRFKHELKNLFPLFRYLILQTETHAFCLALACAALLGFFPSCLVLLSVLKNFLHWDAAYNVLLDTLEVYLPSDQSYLIRNLEVRFRAFGRTELASLLWVLFGAAGVFIPLESGFNRLWKVREDRPYWLNQIVGLGLTIACVALAVFFLSISTGLQSVIAIFPFQLLQRTSNYIIIRITTTLFFIVTIFAFYKFLPNKKINAREVFPAAILAGIMAEVVRVVYGLALPWVNLEPTQGPFSVSVGFILLAYFETFVVLGGAFLASQTERYPWMGFLRTKRSESPPS
jgi:membrane protein